MAPDPALLTFLHGETRAADFHHADHLRMAFEVLHRHPDFLEAAGIYATSLKTIAARAGAPGAYHATITLAFLSLVAERIARRDCKSFDAFAAANADLLDKTILHRWYTPQRLSSPAARMGFVLP